MKCENTTNLNMDKLAEIFISCDDFCQALETYQKGKQLGSVPIAADRHRLCPSEIMSILIYYHHSGYKCFEYYYEKLVKGEMKSCFPKLVSYNRFVELIFKIMPHMYVYSQYRCANQEKTEFYIIDSKKLPVCDNRRIHSNQVFEGFAARGKSSTGWFYGLKLHLVINHQGEIVRFEVTSGNIADNNADLLERLLTPLQGICLGDKGYLTQLFEHFYGRGLKIITKGRKNMKNKIMPLQERIWLKSRSIIESVNDILMTVCDVEHTRHRSPHNAFAHIFAAIAGYSFLEHKPAMILDRFCVNSMAKR
jgi:hypothetical protein